MRPGNPLLVETWRGLIGSNEARLDYLLYLVVQALALLAWWPWGDVYRVVTERSEPKALLAVVMALGVSLALHGVRAGAEEFLLPGQHPLREWLVATPLATGRILSGYLTGHLLHAGYVTLLSMPLVLVGYAVSSAEAGALAWALAAAVVMGMFFRIAGTLVYLSMGHRASGTYAVLRIIVVAAYAIAPLALPAASHPMLAHALLVGGDTGWLATGGIPGQVVFVTLYGVGAGLLAVALYRHMAKHRDGPGSPPSGSRHAAWGARW